MVLSSTLRAFLISTAGVVAGCCSIDVPLSKSDKEFDASVSIAAKLEELKDSGNIKADLDMNSQTAYQTLSDKNVALYLLLQSIECCLRHDKIGKDVALELATTVKAKWSEAIGQKGTATDFQPEEIKQLKKFSRKDDVYDLLGKLGVSVPAKSDPLR